MSAPNLTSDQNLLPVQAYFDVFGNFQTFIGQGQPFYATLNPSQSGLNITNSTINSTTIGLVTPSSGIFTNIQTTTGSISTTAVIQQILSINPMLMQLHRDCHSKPQLK